MAVKGEVPKGARRSGRTPERPPAQPASPRRDLAEDFAPRRRSVSAPLPLSGEDDFVPQRQLGGLRFRVRGVPRSILGRILYGAGVLGVLGILTAGVLKARAELLANPRLILGSSSAVQITGNSHLSRAQLLTVFGGDVDRNILTVPLADRRAELEKLPWVQHTTVMRLLPNRVRVSIVERTPVAFVRQGSRIELVDATGVILDMTPAGGAPDQTHYSFPVVTGITTQEPLSTRGPRMRLFERFISGLGSSSSAVSEVDLSNPEDIKAIIPDDGNSILVHFGSEDFLHRFQLYQKNLPGWRKEFPGLASADMRYERQVVLEMAPGTPTPDAATEAIEKKPAPPKLTGEARAKAIAAMKPATLKPALKPAAKAAAKPATKPAIRPAGHLTTAYDVRRKPEPRKPDTRKPEPRKAEPRKAEARKPAPNKPHVTPNQAAAR